MNYFTNGAPYTSGGSGTNQPAQGLTRRDRTSDLHPAPPGDGTRGLRVRIPTDAVTTHQLRPPLAVAVYKQWTMALNLTNITDKTTNLSSVLK